MARSRGRDWRLAALVLWAAVLLGNLGAAFDLKAAALPSDADIHSSLCRPVNAAVEVPVRFSLEG